ncbi:hypothetical protein [uncultured Oceanisphaera sp.]|nr:hypothetical protein [uncultured Oceanisphaera sp.]
MTHYDLITVVAALVARPLFVWSHNAMMENGALGLSRWLLNGGRS